MTRSFAASMLLLSAPAAAQEQPPQRTIQVTGTGVVQSPPDMAMLEFWIRGEGPSSDAAATALAAKQKAIVGGVGELLGAGSEVTTSDVIVVETRDGSCADGNQPRLSVGDCAVTGFLARMQGRIRTRAIEKAGTAAGLAARLGASDARLQGFALADPEAAVRRAGAAAINDARRRAEAVASGAGVRLGSLMTVRDQSYFSPEANYGVGANSPAAPPAPPPPAAVAIDVKPKPIETRTQVFVTYAIAP